MKIALAAYESKNGDIAFNLKQMERAVKEASGKAGLVVFGEAFLTGFDCLTWDFEKDKNTAVSQDSEVMKDVLALSERYGVGLIFGYIEREEETLYSSCAVVKDGKLLNNYRRISRGWKEVSLADEHYREGNSVVEFVLDGKKLMLALCGDMWDFPGCFKTDGVLIWPVFLSYTPEDWPECEAEYAEQASLAASETLMAGSISLDPEAPSVGGTFYFRDGKTVMKAPFGEESVLTVEI